CQKRKMLATASSLLSWPPVPGRLQAQAQRRYAGPPDPGSRTLLNAIHHAAIICSDYARAKAFYSQVLQLPILAEHYRTDRDSWKLDLALPDGSQLELFSFPGAPKRPSYPEAQGLRHLAFTVTDVAAAVAWLAAKGITCEPIRIDEQTGRQFTFFNDPDGLP